MTDDAAAGLPKRSTPTRGVQIKTEPRCKICSSPHRAEIEDLLCIRSDRATAWVEGKEQKVTAELLEEMAPRKWGITLNRVNMKRHLANHFRKGSPADMAGIKFEGGGEVARQMNAGELVHVAADEALDEVIDIGMALIREKPEKVTVDHLLKAIGEKTKRKSDESRDKLLEGLGAAIAASAGATKAVAEKLPDPSPPPAIEPVVVDAEVVPDGD